MESIGIPYVIMQQCGSDLLLNVMSKSSGTVPPLSEGLIMLFHNIANVRKQARGHPKPASKVPL